MAETEAMETGRMEFLPVDRVEVTILVDNVTDPLLVDQRMVSRVNWPKAPLGALPSARTGVSPESGVPDGEGCVL